VKPIRFFFSYISEMYVENSECMKEWLLRLHVFHCTIGTIEISWSCSFLCLDDKNYLHLTLSDPSFRYLDPYSIFNEEWWSSAFFSYLKFPCLTWRCPSIWIEMLKCKQAQQNCFCVFIPSNEMHWSPDLQLNKVKKYSNDNALASSRSYLENDGTGLIRRRSTFNSFHVVSAHHMHEKLVDLKAIAIFSSTNSYRRTILQKYWGE